MADSPVESSGIQFCVSIWLAVQWSPVESSFVLVYGWQSSGVQWNPVLCQYMVGSPVESSRVQFCIDSPVESSFVLDRFDSPVESRFVNMVQYIVKSSEVQWNPVESTWIAWGVVKYCVLPPDPNPGSSDIHFHQRPWVLMQPKLRKATLVWSIEPHPNMNANTFNHANLVRMTSKFKNPEHGSKTMMVILGVFYHLFSF